MIDSEQCVSLKVQECVLQMVNCWFISVTAEDLWRGVTSVSNPGKKRGRGRSLKKKVNLNVGQKLGKGKCNVDHKIAG